ncbi:uncharacterized protein ACMZJ9_021274 [Mantella aurantiaca]
MAYDPLRITFLDLVIYRDSNGYIQTSLHRKDTAGNSILRAESHHPRHLVQNIPKGQYLRLRRNCSTEKEFIKEAKLLQERFQQRGYSKKVLGKAYRFALNSPRDLLLLTSEKERDSQKTSQTTTRIVTTFGKQSNMFADIVSKHWYLSTDQSLSSFHFALMMVHQAMSSPPDEVSPKRSSRRRRQSVSSSPSLRRSPPRRARKKERRQKSPESRRSRSPSDGNQGPRSSCWGCKTGVALPGKRVCARCWEQVAEGRQDEDRRLVSLIKKAVQETRHQQSEDEGPSAGQRSSGTRRSSARRIESSDSEEDSSSEDEPEVFDYALIQPLIKAVKKAMRWEEPRAEPSPKNRLFKRASKTVATFPFSDEVRDILSEEWGKVDRRPPNNRLARMYPFKAKEVAMLENPPQVDVALLRLAKHVTLPLEDTTSFKDVLDRRMENDLKRVYTSAGVACKPAVAVASVSKALEVWTEDVEEAVSAGATSAETINTLREMKVAANFIAEASVDLIKLLARVMLWSTTSRRALWLKPWIADPLSKQTWCKIPFEGRSLFGDKLDAAISKVTGGRSGFLPQDRQFSKQRKFVSQTGGQNRLREARSYRPGRGSRRPWRSQQQRPAGGTARNQSFRGKEEPRSF